MSELSLFMRLTGESLTVHDSSVNVSLQIASGTKWHLPAQCMGPQPAQVMPEPRSKSARLQSLGRLLSSLGPVFRPLLPHQRGVATSVAAGRLGVAEVASGVRHQVAEGVGNRCDLESLTIRRWSSGVALPDLRSVPLARPSAVQQSEPRRHTPLPSRVRPKIREGRMGPAT